MWSLKTSGMEALAGYWALENPVADRLKPRFRVHLEFLKPVVEEAAAAAVGERGRELTVAHLDYDPPSRPHAHVGPPARGVSCDRPAFGEHFRLLKHGLRRLLLLVRRVAVLA